MSVKPGHTYVLNYEIELPVTIQRMLKNLNGENGKICKLNPASANFGFDYSIETTGKSIELAKFTTIQKLYEASKKYHFKIAENKLMAFILGAYVR